MKLKVGGLFSGIGGIELGLEQTGGFRTVWHSEIDPFCNEVLAAHWSNVPNLGDITKIDWSTVEPVDLICGGVPCQPASVAGKRKGTEDERWLWPAFLDAVRALRPRLVLAENVPGLLTVSGGEPFGQILGSLASMGYDAEWAVFPASAVGAPHKRDRVWIVAHAPLQPEREPLDAANPVADRGDARQVPGNGSALADAASLGRREGRAEHAPRERGSTTARSGGATVENPDSRGLPESSLCTEQQGRTQTERAGQPSNRIFRPIPRSDFWRDAVLVRNRPARAGLCLLAHGVPRRVAKLRALGNGVCVPCARYVGDCILANLDP